MLTRTLVVSGWLALVALAGCGTAPPVVAAAPPPPPPAPVAAPPPAPVVPVEPVFADLAKAKAALVASLVTAAPAKIIDDLDALSRRLALPMMLGHELLTAIGGTGLFGDNAHFEALWDGLDRAAPVAVVWVLPAQSPERGFCTALSFRDAAAARRSFAEMGAAGAQRDGLSARRTRDGDVLWGGVKGRTLFVSNSPEVLLLAGGLAEAAQAASPAGQMVATILPPALIAASGKSREALLSELKSQMAVGAHSGQGPSTPYAEHMAAAFLESAVNLAFEAAEIRLLLDVGPGDGLLGQLEILPVKGSPFAAWAGKRSPYAFDPKLPVRDDRTAVFAFGTMEGWLPALGKVFEASGPNGRAMWQQVMRLGSATSEWSCVFDLAEPGVASLCSSLLKPGTTAKAGLDLAVAVMKAQPAWEAELYGQKPSPVKIKRTGDVVEIEKKIDYPDKSAAAVAKAIAGGDLVRSAYTVKDGRLLQASGREARKLLGRYGAGGIGKHTPLLTSALARTQGAEAMASMDVVAMALRLLGKNKDLPGNQLAMVAAALPGMMELQAPFLFALRGGPSLTGDFRIPLGSLENIAKVLRGMFGASGAGPAN